MKYGIILPSYSSTGSTVNAEDIIAAAQAAEEYGYDSIWTTDHILLPESDSARFRMLFEAIATLAFLAGRTSRVRLGVSSLVLPMRDPVLVARQMSALDALSGGRSMLWEKIMDDISDLDAQIEKAEFGALLAWLREKVHRHGAKFKPMDLVQRVTGQSLTAEPYMRYLREKFGGIYGL